MPSAADSRVDRDEASHHVLDGQGEVVPAPYDSGGKDAHGCDK
jgi:hypothetical protein